MKIKIINRSNKKRSKESMDELKLFAFKAAIKLGIDKKISIIKLIYNKDFYGYYPKGKPLYGFYKLFHNRTVVIYFAKHWDTSQYDRKIAIVHELTHAKQLIEKRLVVSRNFKEAKWNGEVNHSWKSWRQKKYDQLSDYGKDVYTRKHFPWENEVRNNTNLHRNNKFI